MEAKDVFIVLLCVVVSLIVGFGVVRLVDGPRPLRNVFEKEMDISVETKEFEKALKEYAEKNDLDEKEAYQALRSKAESYLRNDESVPIEGIANDKNFADLKARAKEYLIKREKDNLEGMTEEEKSQYLREKAKEYIQTDVERF